MKNEIEIKFLNVNIKKMQKLLRDAGAKLESPMKLMRRWIFKWEADKTQQYIRVRDEGDKITMTYKSFKDNKKYPVEIETTVGDFDHAVAILDAGGIKKYAYQETRREKWTLDNAEICIDEWPWVEPFIEIEADDEDTCKAVAKKLGYDWADGVFGAVDVVYNLKYPKSNSAINDCPMIKFGMPIDECLQK
jgi:adenylate cyclase class 2